MRDIQRRRIIATIITALIVLAVWKFIDWRMQPPPPPQSPEATASP